MHEGFNNFCAGVTCKLWGCWRDIVQEGHVHVAEHAHKNNSATRVLLLCTQEVANRGVTTPNIQIHKIAYTDNTIAAQQSPTHALR